MDGDNDALGQTRPLEVLRLERDGRGLAFNQHRYAPALLVESANDHAQFAVELGLALHASDHDVVRIGPQRSRVRGREAHGVARRVLIDGYGRYLTYV